MNFIKTLTFALILSCVSTASYAKWYFGSWKVTDVQLSEGVNGIGTWSEKGANEQIGKTIKLSRDFIETSSLAGVLERCGDNLPKYKEISLNKLYEGIANVPSGDVVKVLEVECGADSQIFVLLKDGRLAYAEDTGDFYLEKQTGR